MKLFIPTLLLALSVGLFFVYTNPTYQTIKSNLDEQKSILSANKNAQELRAQRAKLLEQKAKISDVNSDRLLKALPDSVENVALIIDINNIAAKYGTAIKNAKVNDAVSGGGAAGPNLTKYGALTMSFSVSMDYFTFISFLKDLESSLRLLDVTAITFSSGTSNKYDFNVTIQTYWLK